jgi:hypothetical protein
MVEDGLRRSPPVPIVRLGPIKITELSKLINESMMKDEILTFHFELYSSSSILFYEFRL